MHRFFIDPKTLGYQAETYNRWDDPKWRALVDEFRWSIRLREWKEIDRRLRLVLRVEDWDGQDVLLIANPRTDDILVDAYIKAGFMENQAIIVFADSHIPWESLREFKAVNPRRGTRHNDGATRHNGKAAIRSSPEKAIKERCAAPTSLVNGSGRSGDPDTVAGDCLIRPKQHEAALDGGKVKPSSQSPTLTGRGHKSDRSPERSVPRPRRDEKSRGET